MFNKQLSTTWMNYALVNCKWFSHISVHCTFTMHALHILLYPYAHTAATHLMNNVSLANEHRKQTRIYCERNFICCLPLCDGTAVFVGWRMGFFFVLRTRNVKLLANANQMCQFQLQKARLTLRHLSSLFFYFFVCFCLPPPTKRSQHFI